MAEQDSDGSAQHTAAVRKQEQASDGSAQHTSTMDTQEQASGSIAQHAAQHVPAVEVVASEQASVSTAQGHGMQITDAEINGESPFDVEAYYGNLHDGMKVYESTPEAELQLLREQYSHRWELKERLALRPDGTVFVHGPEHARTTVRLHTPSNLVPVHVGNNIYQRQPAYPLTIPSSPGFRENEVRYRAYLRAAGLPPYFFSIDHLAMDLNIRERTALEPDFERRAADLHHLVQDMQRPQQTATTTPQGPYLFQLAEGTSVEDAMNEARRRRMYLDIPNHPRGLGRFYWLTNRDAEAGLAQGLTTPADIVTLRATGAMGFTTGPHMVWVPDGRYFNPRTTPAGEGRFEFHTVEDEELARMNLGGQDSGLPADPTAAQVRQLSIERAAAGLSNLTADINIVWIPADDTHVVPPDAEQGEATVTTNNSVTEHPVAAGDEDVDSSADELELITDATNGQPGGEYDQTGTAGVADYVATTINGKRWVIDRSAAKRSKPEPHKFKALSKTGWGDYLSEIDGPFDWTNGIDLIRLNKWRDQRHRRFIGSKRKTPRVTYSKEEDDWFKREQAINEKRPRDGWEAFAKRHFAKFGIERPHDGLRARWSRFAKQKEGERRPRGWNKKKKQVTGAESESEVASPEATVDAGTAVNHQQTGNQAKVAADDPELFLSDDEELLNLSSEEAIAEDSDEDVALSEAE